MPLGPGVIGATDETYAAIPDARASRCSGPIPSSTCTHEKSIVVDEKAALVADFNLDVDKYFTLTRDYGIITDNPLPRRADRRGIQRRPGAIVGGLIATAAMLLPAASLMYVVTLFWQKAQKSKWRIAVEKGFAPLTVGLIMATSLVMSRAADHDWRAYLLTAICTVIFIRTKANPLIVVFAAGVLGYFGIV